VNDTQAWITAISVLVLAGCAVLRTFSKKV